MVPPLLTRHVSDGSSELSLLRKQFRHGVSTVGSISRVPTLAPLVFEIGFIMSFNVECSIE